MGGNSCKRQQQLFVPWYSSRSQNFEINLRRFSIDFFSKLCDWLEYLRSILEEFFLSLGLFSLSLSCWRRKREKENREVYISIRFCVTMVYIWFFFLRALILMEGKNEPVQILSFLPFLYVYLLVSLFFLLSLTLSLSVLNWIEYTQKKKQGEERLRVSVLKRGKRQTFSAPSFPPLPTLFLLLSPSLCYSPLPLPRRLTHYSCAPVRTSSIFSCRSLAQFFHSLAPF